LRDMIRKPDIYQHLGHHFLVVRRDAI